MECVSKLVSLQKCQSSKLAPSAVHSQCIICHYTSRLWVCVPDSRWYTVECEPSSALEQNWAQFIFRYPFHPRVTAVAHKRSWSFCQKCRVQVTAKHAYALRMWLCMKWHGAWLYGVPRTCTEMAAVSCGTSHASAVSTPLRWIFKKRAIKS